MEGKRGYSQSHAQTQTPQTQHPLALGDIVPASTAFGGSYEFLLVVESFCHVLGFVREQDASESGVSIGS